MTMLEINNEGKESLPNKRYTYSVTGSVAHSRLVPLLRGDWEDCTKDPSIVPDFVWENAPRKVTKPYRDQLKAYSHLPNGTAILDSKWVLARLLEESTNDKEQTDNDRDHPFLATLESHCFRGPDGYEAFCERIFSSNAPRNEEISNSTTSAEHSTATFPDLLVNNGKCPPVLPKEPSNLWVVKDAFSNGAGGIWVVDEATSCTLIRSTKDDGPLYADHRYVAQRYSWPPVLYGQRKCHVRVYGLLTADGRAFIHRRAFLHVANDIFSYNDTPSSAEGTRETSRDYFQNSVHITNCCANSHDDGKFAGEILADLETTEFSVDSGTGQTIVPLGPFFPSIQASLATLAKRAWPFVSGGKGNNGFEYLGMDFILSYRKNNDEDGEQHQPIAYLLEVNAPPGQDTATGLKHAEDLHDNVIRDILTLWVIPKVTSEEYREDPGGWRCVCQIFPEKDNDNDSGEPILPSKAAIINKIRWGMLERKAFKAQNVKFARISNDNEPRYVANHEAVKAHPADYISGHARRYFPFFQQHNTDFIGCGGSGHCHRDNSNLETACIFWENAGGSQVPIHVIERVSSSLCHRNRSVIGAAEKEKARESIAKILGAKTDEHAVFLGANATSLLSILASRYVQLGLLQKSDEIVISSENHAANVDPWISAAKQVGGIKIKWWRPTFSQSAPDGPVQEDSWSASLEEVLSDRTRLVVVSHASNVLGQVRDLSAIRNLMDNQCKKADLIVDGVAAAPHWYAALSEHQVDWYVISGHKMFGSHIGGLIGRYSTGISTLREAAMSNNLDDISVHKFLEVGTINYEGCAGLMGLGEYFAELSRAPLDCRSENEIRQTSSQCSRELHCHELEAKSKASSPSLTFEMVKDAYRRMRSVEMRLVEALLGRLKQSSKIQVMEVDEEKLPCLARLPVISFRHETIKASRIVAFCSSKHIACRHGNFLSNAMLTKDLAFCDDTEGVVRFSLVHYNTTEEITYVMTMLESLPDWF